MNDYYHKYLKYKTKYIEIKYGGRRRRRKKNNLSSETPTKLKPQTFSTPSESLVKTPTPSKTFPSTLAYRGTPVSNIESNTLDRLIENKDELFCLLSSNPTLSNYKITTRNTKKIKSQLYINFEINKKDFAHFSFHYPDDEPNMRFEDEFEASIFHLKLDQNNKIVFNLDERDFKLKSKFDDYQIEEIIGKENLIEVKKIITCFEEIFSSDKYKKILGNATARQLQFL
jgi:hypothetical protein